jgi:uncharacterized protein (TIGR02452 family)
MRLNRAERAQMAQETLRILGDGHYTAPSGQHVDIGAAVAASVAGTREFPSGHNVRLPGHLQHRHATRIVVRNETTLAAVHRLTGDHRTIALNFASAKHPGGGFLSGSEAQEESLARSSSLYACLDGLPMYPFHQQRSDALYTDYVIYSPSVVVFRDDGGMLRETPSTCSFVSSPAPNAGAVLRQDATRGDEIRQALRSRIAKVLSIAATQGYDAIVLGAWGCGVFQNDPKEVAAQFHEALTGNFAGVFELVHFAVLDQSRGGEVIAPFQQAFAGAFS